MCLDCQYIREYDDEERNEPEDKDRHQKFPFQDEDGKVYVLSVQQCLSM